MHLRVMPRALQNELIASGEAPRRRRPASVINRGSSQPSTQWSVTSLFNCGVETKDEAGWHDNKMLSRRSVLMLGGDKKRR